jgi:hypothetical protein
VICRRLFLVNPEGWYVRTASENLYPDFAKTFGKIEAQQWRTTPR